MVTAYVCPSRQAAISGDAYSVRAKSLGQCNNCFKHHALDKPKPLLQENNGQVQGRLARTGLSSASPRVRGVKQEGDTVKSTGFIDSKDMQGIGVCSAPVSVAAGQGHNGAARFATGFSVTPRSLGRLP